MCPTIPNSGRLGSLAKTIAEETSKEVLYEVFQDYKTSLKGVKLAEWVLNMIKIHNQDQIPYSQIIQFMHFFMNMYGLGFQSKFGTIPF